MSLVHGSLSSQSTAVGVTAQLAERHVLAPCQLPPPQALPEQTVPSAASVCEQPLSKLQPSTVQGLPSSQSKPPDPLHVPPLHTSPLVQSLPSSQGPSAAALVQPLARSQLSVVHGLPSEHAAPVPALQPPSKHVSPTVQAEPSSQAAVLLLVVQPSSAVHTSSVHGFWSLQTFAIPPTQVPFWHTSPVVHALLSSHVPLAAL